MFSLIMAGVKFGAEKIVTGYGAPGAFIAIGAIIGLAFLIDRR
ncbi:MAG TPA: hypothetical protein VEU47_10925 [Candidatus Cybelea sp.]|nr:hypothetical protein [Candidatus Cybelea sp.]